jgi:hypothetical protein
MNSLKIGWTIETRVARLGDFSPLGDCLLFAVFFNAEAARIFGLLFSQVKAMHYIWREMGCAIFWAIFFTNSSGHPV